MKPSQDRTRFGTSFLDDESGLGKLECYRGQYLPKFREVCRDFAERGWFAENSGNLSVQIEGDEMLITASNVDKMKLTKEDLTLVERYDLANKRLWAYGSTKPSSEAFMHHIIYQSHAARAIVHAHVKKIVDSDKLFGLRTPEFHEEGTLELANAVSEKMREAGAVVILRDHGVIAYGSSLEDASAKISELFGGL